MFLRKLLLVVFCLGLFSPLYAVAEEEGGNVKGSITLTEYYDYQCPHCRNMENVIDSLIRSNPNLRVVYRPLPILGDDSWYEAKAALAAKYQNKFNNFHQLLMYQENSLSASQVINLAQQIGLNTAQLQTDMQKPEVTAELQQNLQAAKDLQVKGVPTFFVGATGTSQQTRFDGEVTYNTLEDVIKKLG